MKNLLLITIGFPPESGGGTIRVAKQAKYLPWHDWALSVVTTTPPKGVTGSVGLPHVQVYRAPRLEIVIFLSKVAGVVRVVLDFLRKGDGSGPTVSPVAVPVTVRRRLADYVFIPDDKIVWAPLAFFVALWATFRNRPKVIYSTSPSPSTHMVGYLLAVFTRLPWVIEFRDPWMFNPFRIERPFAWMERFEGYLEKMVLYRASHIVVTSEEYRRDFLARYQTLSPGRITFIPNGYDLDDFAGITPERFDRFTIVHTGTFYEARSSEPFLEGVALAFARDPSLRGKIQVVFVGVKDERTAAGIERLLLRDVVSQVGIVPHRKSIEYLAGADLLLLVPGPGDGTMPGKTYEYLAVRKQILALCEQGVVSRLVTATATGTVVEPDDVAGIANAVISLYYAHDPGPGITGANEEVLRQFDRREIARRTAELLDDVVSNGWRG